MGTWQHAASILLALSPVSLSAAAMPSDRAASIDRVAASEMQRTGTQGLALAVVEHGEPVLIRTYGKRNAKGDPLQEDTVMYGASITKMVFATYVMQLVQEGRFDLDRPLGDYLPKPLPDYGNLDEYGHWGDLKDDPRWRRITARHVLTHSTGFANYAELEPDQKLRIHFDPGTRYAYSGEGIILLQFVMEQALGVKLEPELERRFFTPLGMTRTSLIWRPDFRPNLADGWKADGKVEPHDERSTVRAAGSMDTTISDLARFVAAFSRGALLKPSAQAEMLRPQLAITSPSQFPSLIDQAPPAARFAGLSAGLGVVIFAGPHGSGFFKGGHNASTGNTLVCVDNARRCVLLLSNDVRAEAAYPALVQAALGDTDLPWRWEYPEQFAGR